MPSKYLRKGANKLKKCAERRTDSCGTETDGCCGVIPCKICLEWETYDGIQYGSADFADTSWQGLVAGLTFVSYWEQTVVPPEDPESITNSVGMSFAQVLPGTYDMGSPVDETGRDADETIESKTIPDKFFLGSTPVTQAQYAAVMGTNPSTFSGGDKPVETVSFANAQAFCAALNALPAEILAGRSYRIPTEAEWEYACRAGTTTAYNFGGDPLDLPTNAWFADNSSASTQDVGGKPANAWGFVDMHGNVWEWCQSSRLDADPVIRGGGYDSDAADCRSASREVLAETTTQDNVGFRVAVTYTPPEVTQCEYVVELDGEEVYRATCYEGASCRDPQGEVAVLTAYLDGTLRWSRYEPRELPLVDDPDTGCRDHFCGGCRCSCRALCIDVSEVIYTDFTDTYSGEIQDVSYSDCEAPVWSGTVGNFDITLTLGRDEYGNCIVTPSVNGTEYDPVAADGCVEMSGSIELNDGSTISFRCKQCECPEVPVGNCICGRPMGETLTLLFASANAPATIHEITLNYEQVTEPDITCLPFSPGAFPAYRGTFSGTLAIPMGGSRTETLEVIMVCACINCDLCVYYRFGSTGVWCQTDVVRTDCTCPALLTVGTFSNPTCDAWSYQISDITIVEQESNC
jgi:hypothetical protein